MKKLFDYAIFLFSITYIVILINMYVVPSASSYAGSKQISQEELIEFFKDHRVGSSPDYAFVKNGHDYLAVFIGYADDRQTCLMAAEEYNGDPSLSTLPGTYQCVPLNK